MPYWPQIRNSRDQILEMVFGSDRYGHDLALCGTDDFAIDRVSVSSDLVQSPCLQINYLPKEWFHCLCNRFFVVFVVEFKYSVEQYIYIEQFN